jgi:hypothetical protein
VAIQVDAVLSGPSLAVTGGQATQFYVDTHAQTINLTANEIDPKGDIIDAFYGPVNNWENLSFTPTNGTNGITPPATIMSAPNNGGLGTTNAGVAYDGSSVNAQSLLMTVADTFPHSAAVTIPFISLANNAAGNTINVQSLGANGCTGPASCTVTVTESASTGGTPTLDPKFSSSSNCASHVTFTPTLGLAGSGNATTAGAVTYTIVANDVYSGVGTCTLTVASQQDANLSTAVTINFPGIAGTSLTGHARSNR